ncbi:Regulation of enolase protein 1 [Vanrija pseudolonga]|uniref:Regulation of enolase protein 1 n=1 Tax=Vanrija pseudolonga TaxID=143232 RepID=A0AAF0YA60_9TREE|nr:Regulation of enolase protein 1 [Vanrija pseudolonga]
MTSVPFTDACWKALHAAHKLAGTPQEDGAILAANTTGGTDWWRTTERDSSDGPTLGFEREIGEGFEISVELFVEPRVQYDQAAIFLWISPTQWIKAGIEYDNGALWNGAVVCNPYSDWSISKRRLYDSPRFTIVCLPNELKVFHGDDMIREVKWFGPTSSNDAKGSEGGPTKAFVGVMACSPKEGGAAVSFKDFTVKEGFTPREAEVTKSIEGEV